MRRFKRLTNIVGVRLATPKTKSDVASYVPTKADWKSALRRTLHATSLLFMLMFSALSAQYTTTLFDTDFESPNHGWIRANGTQHNQWIIAHATYGPGEGDTAAYISNNGGITNTYSSGQASTVHLYREITLPIDATDIVITFDAKVFGGYNAWGLVRISTQIPLAGTNNTADPELLRLFNTPNAAAGEWTSFTIDSDSENYDELLGAVGGSRYLIFTWHNANLPTAFQPPLALDNIKLTYNSPTPPATEGLAFTLNTADNTYIVSIGDAGGEPNIVIPATHETILVRHIAMHGFHNNDVLESVFLPSSIQNIRAAAFFNTPNLREIRLSKDLRTIGDWAFENSGLTSVSLPASVTAIGVNPFFRCNDIETFTVAEENTVFHAEGNSLILTAANELLSGFNTSIIPEGVLSIGNNAFFGMRYITSVAIPNTTTYIGMNAFNGCIALETVILGNALVEIDENAFEGCISLPAIFIPINVVNIGCYAFADCENLTIYAAAESKPDGWSDDWNPDDRPVVWGYENKLGTPVNLHITDNTLSWDAVAKANEYLVCINEGSMEYTVDEPTLSLAILTEAGVYDIKVMALGHGIYIDSDWSETIEYEIEKIQLDTPVNLQIHDKVLFWDIVENANEYLVCINEGSMEYTVDEPNLSLAFLTESGVYELKVMALGHGIYLDSDWSEVYMYEIEVSEDDTVGVVFVTGLKGNYPNPFNPETSIRYQVSGIRGGSVGSMSPSTAKSGHGDMSPTNTHVSIEVYNIRGQRVKTLVNDYFPAGEHSVVWNGKDENGRAVSSGMYLYRMTAGEYTETRRMVLMK